MTREEAIQIFLDRGWIKLENGTYFDGSKWREAIMVISDYFRNEYKALEQEPCEDAIRRDELLKAMDTWDKFGYTETGCFVREPKNDCVKYIHYDDVIKCIKGMPSVTPQLKSEWQHDHEILKAHSDGANEVLDIIRAELIQSIQNGTIKIENGNEELFRIIDKYKVNKHEPKPNIKALGEDMRICQKSITDEKVLIGFNMAVAICNKHLTESEVEQ